MGLSDEFLTVGATGTHNLWIQGKCSIRAEFPGGGSRLQFPAPVRALLPIGQRKAQIFTPGATSEQCSEPDQRPMRTAVGQLPAR